MFIEINPLDTLFFRKGKPFNMGEDEHAEGMFPPLPSTIYGALRSLYFAHNPSNLRYAGTSKDPTRSLVIRSIFYKIDGQLYFPLPYDLVRLKNLEKKHSNEIDVIPLKMDNSYFAGSVIDKKTPFLLSYEEKIEHIEDGLVNSLSLLKYINARNSGLIARTMEEFVYDEPKTGISINMRHTASEGKLYRVVMKRPKTGFSIVVETENLELPRNGIIKIGGEGRTASYAEIDQDYVINQGIMDIPGIKGDRFKLYLSTPAAFENGWLPKWINPETLEGNLNGGRIRLLTAAIGRHITVGGFEMAHTESSNGDGIHIRRGKPKRMYRAVPAGSVYFFETDCPAINVAGEFHHKAISEYRLDKEGFGIVYVGEV